MKDQTKGSKTLMLTTYERTVSLSGGYAPAEKGYGRARFPFFV